MFVKDLKKKAGLRQISVYGGIFLPQDRSTRDSCPDNFRKRSRKFEVCWKLYLDGERFSEKNVEIKFLSKKIYVDYFPIVHEADIQIELLQ